MNNQTRRIRLNSQYPPSNRKNHPVTSFMICWILGMWRTAAAAFSALNVSSKANATTGRAVPMPNREIPNREPVLPACMDKGTAVPKTAPPKEGKELGRTENLAQTPPRCRL